MLNFLLKIDAAATAFFSNLIPRNDFFDLVFFFFSLIQTALIGRLVAKIVLRFFSRIIG